MGGTIATEVDAHEYEQAYNFQLHAVSGQCPQLRKAPVVLALPERMRQYHVKESEWEDILAELNRTYRQHFWATTALKIPLAILFPVTAGLFFLSTNLDFGGVPVHFILAAVTAVSLLLVVAAELRNLQADRVMEAACQRATEVLDRSRGLLAYSKYAQRAGAGANQGSRASLGVVIHRSIQVFVRRDHGSRPWDEGQKSSRSTRRSAFQMAQDMGASAGKPAGAFRI